MGHIYRYYPNLQQEVLWCDMSLNVGDTFHLPEIDGNPWYEYYYNEENTDLIVDSIIYMNGRKIICFQSADFSYSRFFDHSTDFLNYNISLRFIEGVGPSYGPFGFIYLSESSLSVLLCVSQNDSLVYMTHPDLQCLQMGGGSIPLNEKKLFNVYPNPADETLNIDFISQEDAQGELIISDITGNTVSINKINNVHTEIDVSHFFTGTYNLLFINQKGKTTSKFIKK